MMSDSVSISVNPTCAPPCLYVCKNSVSMGAKHANSARKFPLSQHSSKLSRLLAYTPYLLHMVSALSCDPDALAPDVFGTTSARYPLSRSARTSSLLSFD